MALAGFLQGYFQTLRWSATEKAQTILRREITLEEATRNDLVAELTTFYENHRNAIESATGLVGLLRSIAWQAGHDLCFVRNGYRGFLASEWGTLIARRMRDDSDLLGKCEIDYRDGAITVVRV